MSYKITRLKIFKKNVENYSRKPKSCECGPKRNSISEK